MSIKHASILLVSSFAKFALVVYPLAQIAEATFRAAGHSLPPFSAWAGLLAFSLQAYMISSMVSDLAAAIAAFRGQPQKVRPFEASYLSRSISEFWQRWLGWQHPDHSGPLPAIVITAVVAAIYFGLSLPVMAWGGLMALLVACEQKYCGGRALWHKLPGWLGVLLTFSILFFAWVLLRSATFEHAWIYSRALFGRNELYETALILEAQTASDSNLLLLVGSLVIVFVLPPLQSIVEPLRPWKVALAALTVTLVLAYAAVPFARSFLDGQFASLLHRGSATVFVGREGWLFDQRELNALTGCGALDAEVSAHKKPRSRAADEVIRFIGQLKDRKVPLLIIPVPMKASIYPEQITGIEPETDKAPLFHACEPPLYAQFTKAGADVADISAAMIKFMEKKKAVFYKQDSHWTPEAMQALAKGIVDHIRQKYPGVAESNPMITDAKAPETYSYGDLAARLHLNRPEGGLVEERAILLSFAAIASDPSSPVVLLGDDFARIYEDPSLGFTAEDGEPTRASFAQHLALYLGRPLDVITQNGGAPTSVRRAFADRLDDDVRAKKLVVWLLPARDLIAAPTAKVDWATVKFNEAKHPPEAILPMIPKP